MLTVILLVVLGGGAGLLAVWSVDPNLGSRLAGWPGWRSLRAARGDDTTPATPRPDDPARSRTLPAAGPLIDGSGRPILVPAADPVGPADPVDTDVAGDEDAEEASVLEVVAAPVAASPTRVHAPVDPRSGGPARRRRPGSVPAAFTAVEGSYREVVVTPLWRKVVSLVLLLGVLFGVGIGFAVIAAAVIGIAAELVNGAIG